MGDRANVYVQTGSYAPGEGVYLYSHWGGHDLFKTLQKALTPHERWDDHAYLTRIIAREMGLGQGGETGFGISTRQPDNEYRVFVIDCDKRRVGVSGDTDTHPPNVARWWSMDEFLALDADPRRDSEGS